MRLVPSKEIWLRMGFAVCLAGMGADACLCGSCDYSECRHFPIRAYEVMASRHGRTLVDVLLRLLVEGREASLEMGKQETGFIEPRTEGYGSQVRRSSALTLE